MLSKKVTLPHVECNRILRLLKIAYALPIKQWKDYYGLQYYQVINLVDLGEFHEDNRDQVFSTEKQLCASMMKYTWRLFPQFLLV